MMTKPYFARYLPVEGEIEVGDKVESESSGRPKVTVTCITEEGDYVTDERDWYEPDSYFVLPKEKAKKFSKTLFLCSRDIQVGDKVTNNQGAIIPWNEDMQTLFETGVLLKDGLFKVIGEISPEAIWVKEGDEFEESELLARPGGASIRRELKHWSPQYLGNNCEIFIKCPTCKKFH